MLRFKKGAIYYVNVCVSVDIFFVHPHVHVLCVCMRVCCEHHGSLSEKGQGGFQKCHRGQQAAERGDTGRGLK